MTAESDYGLSQSDVSRVRKTKKQLKWKSIAGNCVELPESVKLCCCCCCCYCCRCFGSALRLVATCVFPAEKPETALETEKTHLQSFSARLRRSSREVFFVCFVYFLLLFASNVFIRPRLRLSAPRSARAASPTRPQYQTLRPTGPAS